jgi:hypothetical protein
MYIYIHKEGDIPYQWYHKSHEDHRLQLHTSPGQRYMLPTAASHHTYVTN